MRIRVLRGMVTVWIEDLQINQWSLPPGWSPPMDSGFQQALEGTIALQGSRQGTVSFKDIMVRLL